MNVTITISSENLYDLMNTLRVTQEDFNEAMHKTPSNDYAARILMARKYLDLPPNDSVIK